MGGAGFAPYQNEWERIAPRIEARLNYLVGLSGSGLTPETAAEIRQHLHSADPKSLWRIAERDEKLCGVKLGKALILEWSETCFPGNSALTGQSPAQLRETISWHGACDLKNAECQNRFIAYISSGHSLSRQRKGANIPAITTF